MEAKQVFEAREVVEITGVPERSVRYWASMRGGISVESTGRSGVRRKFSEFNLIEVAILRELNSLGLTMSAMGEALEKVREKGEIEDFCWLILQGETIQVFTTEDMVKGEFGNFAKNFEAWVKPIIDRRNLLTTKESGKGIDRVALFASIGAYVFSGNKTSVVVPVHRLVREIKDKIKDMT